MKSNSIHPRIPCLWIDFLQISKGLDWLRDMNGHTISVMTLKLILISYAIILETVNRPLERNTV